MFTQWQCRRIREAYRDAQGHCAAWVNVRYLEPWGYPEWAVTIRMLDGSEIELARGARRSRVLKHALRVARNPALVASCARYGA